MMKKLTIFLLLFYSTSLYSQIVTVEDFVALASLTGKRVNSYTSKMGFVQVARTLDDGTIVSEFFYRNKKQPYDTTLRFITGYKKDRITGVVYNTSSYTEYYSIMREFRLNGFVNSFGQDSVVTSDSVMSTDTTLNQDITLASDTLMELNFDTTAFLQKGDMIVRTREDARDEVKVFQIILERKPIPTSSSIRYADDLLLFESHANLVAMFGEKNVTKDIYYFSESEKTPCSVIFPNTNRQAIFIWDDPLNYRQLSFLMIGGGLKPQGPNDYSEAVALNAWRSVTGLYTGMRMQEILRVNESDFQFYGASSEFAFMAVPEKKGNIDFRQTGIVLGCFNCNGSPIMRKEKVSAQAATDAGIQLYILSMILMPESP